MNIPAAIKTIMYNSLYSAVEALMKAKPWNYLQQTDVFGVQDPSSVETAFITCRGTGPEDFALLAFKGFNGLDRLWSYINSGATGLPNDLLLSCNAISLVFCKEDVLTDCDRENVMAYASGNTAGSKQYCRFRTHKAGFNPQYLDMSDICLLTHVIRQTTEIVQRLSAGTLSLAISEGHEDEYFIRVPVKNGELIIWEDATRTINLNELLPEQINTQDMELLKKLAVLPVKEDFKLYLNVYTVITGEPEKELPAKFIFSAASEKMRGLYCAVEYTPGPDVFTLYPFIQPLPASIIFRQGCKPSRFIVNSNSLLDTFQDMADVIGTPIVLEEAMPEMLKIQTSALEPLFANCKEQPAILWF